VLVAAAAAILCKRMKLYIYLVFTAAMTNNINGFRVLQLMAENIPWVEKYRPNNFESIVLDPMNRQIFENILETHYFPNLMFYGPPGTGKTTTVINLINEYQQRHNQTKNGTLIHLNASDERGIDIIRNNIYQFVKTKNFFEKGLKFVILDEVDYMTKNAQQALKFLLQSYCYNVRFCLICNYISKIDESLKNEFICIRFNQLPQTDIYRFIKNISEKENLFLSDNVIGSIQQLYNSDIRSMINFMQLNQNITHWDKNIINDELWENLHALLTGDAATDEIHSFFSETSLQYNIDKLNIIKHYFNYVIRKKIGAVTPRFLNIVEVILHLNEKNIQHILLYFTFSMRELYVQQPKN
jgi:replication factor C subunit 3/5